MQTISNVDRISAWSTISGLVIGTFVLCANFQFGLQTGWVSMMSMPAALLGFAWFKTLRSQLTAQENVYIQSVAVAVGTGPSSFGLVGAIPAIQSSLTDKEGKTDLGVFQSMLWALGIGFTGIFTALLLRDIIIPDKSLTFPSGSAAAALIGVLHNKPIAHQHTREYEDHYDTIQEGLLRDDSDNSNEGEPVGRTPQTIARMPNSTTPDELTMSPDHRRDTSEPTYRRNIIVLLTMFMISSSYTLLSKIFWFLRAIPIFGSLAAKYMWNFELSPAYIGQGIVMGFPTTASMMSGAILGWAVLAPLSKHMGWAPGSIEDWQTGAQGWIMWISLAIMVADTGVSFVILTISSVRDFIRHGQEYEWINNEDASRTARTTTSTRQITENYHESVHEAGNVDENEQEDEQEDDEEVDEHQDDEDTNDTNNHSHVRANHRYVPSVLTNISIESPSSQRKLALWGLLVSSILCIVCVNLLFGNVPTLALTIAVGISPLLSLLGVRALGETDLNPVSSIAKSTQFVFGIMMRSHPHAVLSNIVAGAITEAGAQQAGDSMQDYKTGGLLGALMTHQTIGMIVGTVWSVIVSGFVFKLYTTKFTIPGPEFRVPTAYIWADCARLMTGEGLPPHAGTFALVFAAVFTVIALCKQVIWKHKPWVEWLPSGVAVGIGMYNVPSFTIARFIGGVIALSYQRRCKRASDEVYLVILSSGLILGEGIMSVLYLIVSV